MPAKRLVPDLPEQSHTGVTLRGLTIGQRDASSTLSSAQRHLIP